MTIDVLRGVWPTAPTVWRPVISFRDPFPARRLVRMVGRRPSTARPPVDEDDAEDVPGPHRDVALLTQTPPEQLATLLHEHSPAMYRVALSVVRDPDLAEDVTQDALLRAWQALPTFRGDAPLRNWVLRITHNTAVSTLRRRRDDAVDPSELPEPPTRPADRVEHRVEARLSVDAFEQALSSLDELSRSVVVLREIEGLSYEEISALLKVPLPTVKTRLLRSRRVLARALEGWRP